MLQGTRQFVWNARITVIAWLALAPHVCVVDAAGQESRLSVRVTSTAQELLVREQLPIAVQWEVSGDSSIQVKDAEGTLRSARTAIYVLVPDGSSHVIRQVDSNPIALGVAATSERQPGETWNEMATVSCAWPDPDVPIFDEVGKYEIWVQYNDGKVKAESNRVVVQVRGTQDHAEKKALALVRQLVPAGVLYHIGWAGTSRTEQSIEILRRITEIDGSIVYRSYASLALATKHIKNVSYARHFPQHDIDIADELEQARVLFEKVDASVKSLHPVIHEIREFIAFERQRLKTDSSEYKKVRELELQIKSLLESRDSKQ